MRFGVFLCALSCFCLREDSFIWIFLSMALLSLDTFSPWVKYSLITAETASGFPVQALIRPEASSIFSRSLVTMPSLSSGGKVFVR